MLECTNERQILRSCRRNIWKVDQKSLDQSLLDQLSLEWLGGESGNTVGLYRLMNNKYVDKVGGRGDTEVVVFVGEV